MNQISELKTRILELKIQLHDLLQPAVDELEDELFGAVECPELADVLSVVEIRETPLFSSN